MARWLPAGPESTAEEGGRPRNADGQVGAQRGRDAQARESGHARRDASCDEPRARRNALVEEPAALEDRHEDELLRDRAARVESRS